jgi:hypothetical protein
LHSVASAYAAIALVALTVVNAGCAGWTVGTAAGVEIVKELILKYLSDSHPVKHLSYCLACDSLKL